MTMVCCMGARFVRIQREPEQSAPDQAGLRFCTVLLRRRDARIAGKQYCLDRMRRALTPGLGVIAVFMTLASVSGCVSDTTGPASGSFTPARPGVLVVATNLPAPGFWEGSADAPTGGFEHGLALELMRLFDLDELRVVDVPFEDLVAGDLGGADVALAELTPTTERDAVLDFSTAYLDAHPAVLVRDGTAISDLSAARDLRWVVQAGSTQVALARERIRPDVLIELDDIQAVVDAVTDDAADAALLDLPTALVEERLTGGELRVVAQFANDDVIAIAVADGDPNLEALDSAVRAMLRDGTIDRLAAEWLGQDVSGNVVEIPLIRAKPVN
jgi:polar amino acid transport system substrate-binding protein